MLSIGLVLVSGIGGAEVVELVYHPCGDTSVFCFGEPRECDGLINNRGEILHRFQVSHRINGPFNEGLIAAEHPHSGHWGYLDTNGGWAIPPRFGAAGPFQNGLARAQDAKTGLWGFVNSMGAFRIAPEFQEAFDFDDEGFAVVFVGRPSKEDGLAGAIDRSGEVVIQPQFLAIGAFSGGYAQAVVDSGACMLIDGNGQYEVVGGSEDFAREIPFCRPIAIDSQGRHRPSVDPAGLISFRSSRDAFPNLALPTRYRLDSTYEAAGRSCHGLDQIHRYDADGTHDAGFVDQTGKLVFSWKWRWNSSR